MTSRSSLTLTTVHYILLTCALLDALIGIYNFGFYGDKLRKLEYSKYSYYVNNYGSDYLYLKFYESVIIFNVVKLINGITGILAIHLNAQKILITHGVLLLVQVVEIMYVTIKYLDLIEYPLILFPIWQQLLLIATRYVCIYSIVEFKNRLVPGSQYELEQQTA
ncbi:hypothetical protein CHUAL_001302 [Chamberlinius hualienensis]